jgi:hypothetical protein
MNYIRRVMTWTNEVRYEIYLIKNNEYGSIFNMSIEQYNELINKI